MEFFLIYDPLAFTARAFGASGRVRPYCKDTLFVIGKNQHIAFSQRGQPTVEQVLTACATLQGVLAPDAVETQQDQAPPSEGESVVRKPGGGPARVQEVESEAALAMLDEEDSLYVLVDVRTISEFESDRSTQALHLPVDEVTHRYHELGQTDHLIFICQNGGRSAQAAEFMASIGSIEVYNVIGGMTSWEGDRTTGPSEG